jgi:hypothetical protein
MNDNLELYNDIERYFLFLDDNDLNYKIEEYTNEHKNNIRHGYKITIDDGLNVNLNKYNHIYRLFKNMSYNIHMSYANLKIIIVIYNI